MPPVKYAECEVVNNTTSAARRLRLFDFKDSFCTLSIVEVVPETINLLQWKACLTVERHFRDFTHCGPDYNLKSGIVVNQSRWFPPQNPSLQDTVLGGSGL